jgi:glycosyltransferase involved in cell wall biosynthesis
LQQIAAIIQSLDPDLVHIHGSERFYGRLKSEALIDTPSVVSIQGLTGTVAPCVWGGLSLMDLLPYQRPYDAIRNFPLLRRKGKMLRAAEQERLTLQNVQGIIGRTAWDRAHAHAIAPEVPYYHVDEMMRSDFQAHTWAIEATESNQLFTTANLSLLKGIHILIEAIAILKIDFPEVVLNIAGGIPRGCEMRLFQSLIEKHGVKDNIRLLGWLPSEEIIQHMLRARAFVYASLIENGCNSVSEAMLLGMPVVSTFTGGMTTTIAHRKTGVLAPKGDAAVLASEVGALIAKPEQCQFLGQAAKKAASDRHHRDTIVDALVRCCQKVRASND